MRAMILAAGLGSRLKPWTDHHPKALAIVNGKSLLQRNIKYLRSFGITSIVVNVHHFAEQVLDALEKNDGFGCDYIISDEREEVLETGGGLVKAQPYLVGNAPFVLMNVDILTDLNLGAMLQNHLEHAPLATLATRNRETSRYLLFDDEDRLCGWKNIKTGEEKPALQNGAEEPAIVKHPKAFSGIHIIDPKIFSLVKQEGKFSMIDVYLDLMADHTIRSFDHTGSRFIDVGKPESVLAAEQMFI